MATYLYCVLTPPSADAPPAGLRGIGGAPVRMLTVGDGAALEAWVATIDESLLLATGDALAAQALVHNEVVNAALETGRTPAPARYGTRFANDTQCVVDLRGRASELLEILARVAGTIEMSVLLVPLEVQSPKPLLKPRPTEAAAGRRYLESVRSRAHQWEERRAAAEEAAERVSRVVGKFIRDEARSFGSAGVMSIAHLVSRSEVAEYRTALAEIVQECSFRLVVSGPRAPYSFAAQRPSMSGHDSGSPDLNEERRR
jgi:Gas vesicle synthesis protein GvpL/GvpF